MTTLAPSRSVNPFAAIPVVESLQEKPIEKMTHAQKRWAKIIRDRVTDPNWRLFGEDWNTIKWELHYLMGYTLVPGKDISNQVFNNDIDSLKSVGLVVVHHFWTKNAQPEEPEIGIAARLYKLTYDPTTGDIVYGHNGIDDDAGTSCSLAKNLAYTPHQGARGSAIDPVQTPVFFNAALAIEQQLTIAATTFGRRYLEDPSFPPCLVGFSPNRCPALEDVSQDTLKDAALRYLLSQDNDGYANNGDLLSALQIQQNCKVTQIDKDQHILTITTDQGQSLKFPSCIDLRSGVVKDAELKTGTVVGDLALPANCDTDSWDTVAKALGEYGADFMLCAVYDQALHPMGIGDDMVVCMPQSLITGAIDSPLQMFVDLRGELGRICFDPDNPDKPTFAEREAKIHTVHLRQPACPEAMQFSGRGFRADLFTVRPYWEKHFLPGKPPFVSAKKNSVPRGAALIAG